MSLKKPWYLPATLMALSAVAPAFAADEPKAAADEAQIEAKLAAARERLEAAAREVADLSGQLTGPVMREFMVTRSAPRAALGVTLSRDAEGDREGVVVDSVTPKGPASAAGIKAGDVLVSIDGKSLRSAADSPSGASILVRHMRSVKPGDKVKVEYLRGGKTQKAEVVAEAMDLQRFAHVMPPDHLMMVPRPGMAPRAPRAPDAPFAMAFRDFPGFPGHGLHEMELITLTPKLGHYFGTDKGVLVVRPPSESELKLEEGDVIVDIDGRAPQSGSHAMRILRSYQPGEKVNVNVLRNRKSIKLQYTLPQRSSRGDAAWELGDGDFDVEMFREEAPEAGSRVEKAPPAAGHDST